MSEHVGGTKLARKGGVGWQLLQMSPGPGHAQLGPGWPYTERQNSRAEHTGPGHLAGPGESYVLPFLGISF